MKKFFGEFKEFISRGNVLDMAVGVIIATAFGKITTSLVNDVVMPFIGWIFGGTDATQALNITLTPAVYDEAGEVVKEATVLGFGTFVSTIIDFIIIAFIVFLIVKSFNKARQKAEERKKKEEEEAAEEEAPPEPTNEELLLTEIRDLLKNKK
ncbi:MAG: large-conductance mechanosensitive channel protein MscL [Oscillospiraceae bacterium]|nr:large-conductance mechanosensitive channel protein MscL [Oscillospiraceae bacterium]